MTAWSLWRAWQPKCHQKKHKVNDHWIESLPLDRFPIKVMLEVYGLLTWQTIKWYESLYRKLQWKVELNEYLLLFHFQNTEKIQTVQTCSIKNWSVDMRWAQYKRSKSPMCNRHGEIESTFYTDVGQNLLCKTEIPFGCLCCLVPSK